MADKKILVVEVSSDVEENRPIMESESKSYMGESRNWLPSQSSDKTVFLAVLIAALGPLAFGYATGYSSPALEDLELKGNKPFLTLEEGAWFSVSDSIRLTCNLSTNVCCTVCKCLQL